MLGKEVIEVKIENVNFIEGHATLKVYYGDDYLLPVKDDGDEIIFNHNEEISRVLENKNRDVSLARNAG